LHPKSQDKYSETPLCPANDYWLPGWPETGSEEVNGDLSAKPTSGTE
jgi:hypothetical protein